MADKIKRPKPTYWGRIPAEVRYDKSLPAAARLLYAEFDALSRKQGYCWASNSYFADLYDVDVATVSKWIKKLADNDHITMAVRPEEGNRRYIYLLTKKSIALLTKKSVPIDENAGTPIDENVIPSINSTSINKRKEKPPPPIFKKDSKEWISWNNYQQAKVRYQDTYDPEFFDFFELEVMARFTKQEVNPTTLKDWYTDIWGIYETEDVISVLKEQRAELNAWQVKWPLLKSRLKSRKKERKNIKISQKFQEHKKAQDDEKTQKTKKLQRQRLELARNDPDEFNRQYETDQSFKFIVDKDPKLSRFVKEATG